MFEGSLFLNECRHVCLSPPYTTASGKNTNRGPTWRDTAKLWPRKYKEESKQTGGRSEQAEATSMPWSRELKFQDVKQFVSSVRDRSLSKFSGFLPCPLKCACESQTQTCLLSPTGLVKRGISCCRPPNARGWGLCGETCEVMTAAGPESSCS